EPQIVCLLEPEYRLAVRLRTTQASRLHRDADFPSKLARVCQTPSGNSPAESDPRPQEFYALEGLVDRIDSGTTDTIAIAYRRNSRSPTPAVRTVRMPFSPPSVKCLSRRRPPCTLIQRLT